MANKRIFLRHPIEVISKICLILLAVILFLPLHGCFRKKPQKQMPPRPVEIGQAIKKDVPIYIESFGNLISPYSVDIQSQVTGQIKEVHFKDGDMVSKGDLLFTIDPSQYKAELDKSEAALIEDLAGLKLKKDTLDRNKKLFEKELISQQDLETYQTEVTSAEATVKLDTANIELAKINLGYCYISSPIDGLTGKRRIDPGNIVTANDGPVLVNVKSVDPLYMDFTIPERELTRLRKAMSEHKLTVELTAEGDDNDVYSGDLQFLDNTVDNSTGTIALRAVVSNKNRALWTGQFAKVRLILGTEKDAVLTPYESVQLGQKGAYIFTVSSDNKADLRNVTVGSRQEDYVVIEKGVEAGEKVVTSGQMGLSHGVIVIDIKQLETQEKQTKGVKK